MKRQIINILILVGVLLILSCKKEKDEPIEPTCYENPQPAISLTCTGYCYNCEEEPFPTNDVYFKINVDGAWAMFQAANANGTDFYTLNGQTYTIKASGEFRNPDNPIKNFALIQILSYASETDFVEDTTVYDTWLPDVYSPGDLRNNTAGFVIQFTDENGTTWTTQNNNSAGTMTITERSPMNSSSFYVKGKFETKLWLPSGTSLINNVSGEFRTIMRTR